VREEIALRLTRLNQEFYQTFADSFSSTRGTVQPGVREMIRQYIPSGPDSKGIRLLDIGCGNGNQARELADAGFQGTYAGIDFAIKLLSHAFHSDQPVPQAPTFMQADITQAEWHTRIPGAPFDRITCYAVMHHIPGISLRARIYREIHKLITPQGYFVQSNWQFAQSPHLLKRLQPWEAAGISEKDVEPGDYLLDWRGENGRIGLRYVHLAGEEELRDQAREAGFRIEQTLIADNQLGLYHVWRPIPA
jgi:2-polyprenyl-3-methyl-5-hydroxy-6-metoxy-1,4-benzoquinol methylase